MWILHFAYAWGNCSNEQILALDHLFLSEKHHTKSDRGDEKTMISSPELLAYSLKSVKKKFPGVLAIDDVDLNVKQGEIHGIIGKNGAGKSVLMTIIAGITTASDGKMFLNDKEINLKTFSPSMAKELGIVLIPQEPLIFPYMSVIDNLFINSEKKQKSGLLDMKSMEKVVLEIAEKMSIKISPYAPIGSLPLEDQQLLYFGKSLFINHARIILLDEITASLPNEKKLQLLNILRERIKENPTLSFTLITHYINEVISFCDRVTILRDGKAIKTLNVPETNAKELSDYIVGECKDNTIDPASLTKKKEINTTEEPILKIKNLCHAGHYKNINLDLHKNEVIGLAGLDGSGKYEFLETLAGLIQPGSGDILFNGHKLVIDSPATAIKKGITYLPKKREEEAIIHNRSVEENGLISIYERISNWFGWIDYKNARSIVAQNIQDFNVKTPSSQTIIDNLSGGNRQKMMINRVRNTNPVVYLLNEPTRGVDISTKPEVLRTVRELLSKNSGVFVTIESEEELINISDIIYVFYKGEIRKVFTRGEDDFCFPEVYKSVQGVGLS